MTVTPAHELPQDRADVLRRARRLEWITIAYLISAVIFIYLTLGASQAMKAAWYEDLLSLVPPIAFLIGARIRRKKPNARFPYGYHRAVTISYLCASLALFVMGLFIFYDSVTKLIAFEHPPIGMVQPFGEPIWLGWFMFPALAWSAIPAFFLGRAKLEPARRLHDKVLHADAKMNKADWLTATAAAIGVFGIGIGWWWLDPIAAIVISFDITHDGFKNLRLALSDLMDSRPMAVDGSANDPIVARLESELTKRSWVKDARVRLREDGHVFFGEALVVTNKAHDLPRRLEETADELKSLDWRLQDIVLAPVTKLEEREAEQS